MYIIVFKVAFAKYTR